ncbi:MAG: DsbA family protein [Acidimicrobiales bacterium]|nr:DsbA family protein [Acidimicrobiales bacterium]
MSAVLEVFADVGCPFTHVGLRRVVEARHAAGREDVRLWVRAWPLEIVNGMPLAADHVAREVEALRSSVAPQLFRSFNANHYPASTLAAMALAAAAYDQGLEAGEAVSLELRDRLFERGENLANVDVLVAVAEGHGLPVPLPSPDLSPVYRDYEEGKRRGVTGSPHFFVGGAGFFCPGLKIEQHDGQFQITPATEEFDRFLANVLGT